MKIGLIDADLMDNGTRHPNLALMKIGGYHKKIGDQVTLIYDTFDNILHYEKVYISCVFNFTLVPEWVKRSPNVIYGGTGFFEDGGPSLPDYIEHCMPYYDLYKEYIEYNIANGKDASFFSDYLDYSIGFMTRGCFRKCEFCVNKKYNKVERHSSVEEFVDKDRPMIYLWDDNILAYPQWENILDELEATDKPFQFRQGIDIRLMTDNKAYRLNHAKYHGDFIFAFDHLRDKELITRKIQLWKRYTNKYPKMYVLAAYNSQDANDIADVFERIKILMKYGCLPYIMRYEKYKDSKYKGIYTQIARWCNQPQFYKKMSFREFCERNQFYHTNPNTLCASYKALKEFEIEEPDIARKYFDLKLIYENVYDASYGFGRKYHNKQECSKCKEQGRCWDKVVNYEVNLRETLTLYYQKEIELCCLKYQNSECIISEKEAGKYLSNLILGTDRKLIYEIIRNSNNLEVLNKNNSILPKNKNEYYINVLNILFENNCDDEFFIKSILEVKNLSTKKEKQEIMESLRLLALMDFIILSKNNINGKVKLSQLGSIFIRLDKTRQHTFFSNNLYRLPLVQYFIRTSENIFRERLALLCVKNVDNVWEYLQDMFNDVLCDTLMVV